MPINTNINVPFIPQEGITAQILQAMQLANEHHAQQQQFGIQQQQANTQQQSVQQQAPLIGAQTDEARQNIESQKTALDIRKREMEYVFGAGGGGGQASGASGPVDQKPGLLADIGDTKSRLGLKDEEGAAFDQAVRNVQVGFLSSGKLDMSPVDKVIEEHLARQSKVDTDLRPTFRNEGNQWYQDMHTSDGKLAYSIPVPPPSEYLSHSTEGTDYMRTVDAQTGKVTITPISTQRVETPLLPGQAPSKAKTGTPGKTGGSFELPGAGKKLSEAGQSMITGLTEATDFTKPAMDFLSKTPPSLADWYSAVAKYKLGGNPGGEFANTFQAIGMARAIATGPLLHGIRNQAIIRGIQEHLPDITDSPSLALQKMKDLQPFWKQAMDEVYKTENVTAPKSSADDLANEYLKGLGK